MHYIIFAALLTLAACGSVDQGGARCEIGRAQSCACVGGGIGAQECSPAGIYSACVCVGADASADVPMLDAVVDASTLEAAATDSSEADTTHDSSEVGAPDAAPTCIDRDGDGYGEGCPRGPDCDDGDLARHPGAEEACDGIDQNCNGDADERFGQNYCDRVTGDPPARQDWVPATTHCIATSSASPPASLDPRWTSICRRCYGAGFTTRGCVCVARDGTRWEC